MEDFLKKVRAYNKNDLFDKLFLGYAGLSIGFWLFYLLQMNAIEKASNSFIGWAKIVSIIRTINLVSWLSLLVSIAVVVLWLAIEDKQKKQIFYYGVIATAGASIIGRIILIGSISGAMSLTSGSLFTSSFLTSLLHFVMVIGSMIVLGDHFKAVDVAKKYYDEYNEKKKNEPTKTNE